MSGPRGIQLSGTQVTASVLATLTGAVAASYLGVGGTLVGAAVGSVASTMGTEIYKHYLLRSQERLRSAGQVLVQSTARTRTGNTMSQTGAGATRGGRHAASGGQASQKGTTQELADRETAVWDRRQYGTSRDPHETQMIPGIPTQWDGTPSGGGTNGGAGHGGGRPGDTASHHAHGNLSGEGPAGEEAGRGGLWEAVTSFFGGLTRRQWLNYGGIAAAFFLVIMAAITVFELTIGKPLSAAVTGGHSTGTSLFGHSSPRHKAPTHPASSPSATPTGSTPASPTPTAGTSSGTPAPSTPAGSTSPSALPSATPTTGSSSAARSSTTATPTP
ncbi:MAG: hypothetical protein ACR2MP_17850 [Streptosporangiaceae bacterium]